MVDWRPVMTHVYREYGPEARREFEARGWKPSDFFPHRVHSLPKCGPDGLWLVRELCGVIEPDALHQVVLHAYGPVLDEFPAGLFFDEEILRHGQHFNLPGQVATAALARDGSTLYSMAHHSDLVQRISRRRALKTRVEKRFRGWHRLLLHAIVADAARRGIRRVCVPSARHAMRHTDLLRTVRPELFERVYDRAVGHLFAAVPRGDWWEIDVARNRSAVVSSERRTGEIRHGRTVCIVHDTERGFGHRDVDAAFAERADRESPAALSAMLEIERRLDVRTTYSVVGCFLEEVRGAIADGGHALAFHSFDHGPGEQLRRCRAVDYRLKGYRPPRSALTPELTETELCLRNFEWLASGVPSLGFDTPRVQGKLVRIPIRFDDFDLHRGTMDWRRWRERAHATVRAHDFVAFGLHDCYAEHWLPHYEALLRELQALAELRTLDDVAADLHLAAAE
jgi:peptidoglycan/xylan/chitin deacetylase (PgdA/CDA1 family)